MLAHRHLLEETKQAQLILEIEETLRVPTTGSVAEDKTEALKRYMDAFPQLTTFYSSKANKRLGWDRKKATRQLRDEAVSSGLKLGDPDTTQSIYGSRNFTQENPFLLSTAASGAVVHGPSSLHNNDGPFSLPCLISLGYKVVLADEFLTPKMRSSCGARMDKTSMRTCVCVQESCR